MILGHYPLDWGYVRAGGKVLKAYLDGGSVTIGGKTVSFAGKNGAVCYGNFHGHLHNFKTSRIYVVPDNVSQSDPPTQQMAALRICCPSANYYRTNEVGDNNRLDSNQIEFGEETTHSKAPGVTDTAFTVNVINPADKKSIRSATARATIARCRLISQWSCAPSRRRSQAAPAATPRPPSKTARHTRPR